MEVPHSKYSTACYLQCEQFQSSWSTCILSVTRSSCGCMQAQCMQCGKVCVILCCYFPNAVFFMLIGSVTIDANICFTPLPVQDHLHSLLFLVSHVFVVNTQSPPHLEANLQNHSSSLNCGITNFVYNTKCLWFSCVWLEFICTHARAHHGGCMMHSCSHVLSILLF